MSGTNNTLRMQIGETREQYIGRAVGWCRNEYRKRRQRETCHVSHTANDVMCACERLFCDLGTFGTCGDCDDIGQEGIEYLNTGEMYELTVAFRTQRGGCFYGAAQEDILRAIERLKRG